MTLIAITKQATLHHSSVLDLEKSQSLLLAILVVMTKFSSSLMATPTAYNKLTIATTKKKNFLVQYLRIDKAIVLVGIPVGQIIRLLKHQ